MTVKHGMQYGKPYGNCAHGWKNGDAFAASTESERNCDNILIAGFIGTEILQALKNEEKERGRVCTRTRGYHHQGSSEKR